MAGSGDSLAAEPKLAHDAAKNYILLRRGHPVRLASPRIWSKDQRLRNQLVGDIQSSPWIVDALFGTGLCRPLESPYDEIAARINTSRNSVLAIDIPSGLDCDTGEPLGPTICATHTATFVAPKRGFLNPASREWTGEVHVIDIGALRALVEQYQGGAVDPISWMRFPFSLPRNPSARRFTRSPVMRTSSSASLASGSLPPRSAARTPSWRLLFTPARNSTSPPPATTSVRYRSSRPCRIVVVENADPFVTEHRPALEQYAAKPSAAGILILELKSFPETTKLAKALPDAAKVTCKSLPAYKLPAWCVEWAKSRHEKKLAVDAAEVLVELVGTSMGLLDQELSKLASAVGEQPGIGAEDVQRFVGKSKSADVFRILDAIGEGKPGQALSILEELFAEGEDPMAILGPLTAQLRKLAAVGRLHLADGLPLGPAMDAAKVPAWPRARESTERQLRHLGRRRLEKLTEWLTEINLGLKGGNPLPERVQVERLVVQLARPR